jgi:hypothetical protein
VFVIICEPDADVAAKRLLERDAGDAMRGFFHGDKQTEDLLPPAEYEPPVFEVSTIKVCTLNGYDPDLEEIRNRIV